jgi:ribosomal protein L16 Arg81 hydroxylase
LTEGKRREAAALAAAAKREAERLVADAHNDVVSFKNWLGNAVVEAERLHKVQSQSLSAAEEAIRQTRARLTTAFEKLESLGRAIDASIGADGRPVKSESTDESAPSMRSAARRTPVRRAKPAPAKAKGATKVDPKKQAASKVAPKTSAKATSKPSAKKVASKRK